MKDDIFGIKKFDSVTELFEELNKTRWIDDTSVDTGEAFSLSSSNQT